MATHNQIVKAMEILTQTVSNADVGNCSIPTMRENFNIVSLIFENVGNFVLNQQIPTALFRMVSG